MLPKLQVSGATPSGGRVPPGNSFGITAVCSASYRLGPVASVTAEYSNPLLTVGAVLLHDGDQAASRCSEWSRVGHLVLPLNGVFAGSQQSAFAVPGSLTDGVGVLARPAKGPESEALGPSLNIGWRVANLLLFVQADGRLTVGPIPMPAQVQHLTSQVSEDDLIRVAEWMNARAAELT